jgi:hypothetical protein
MSDTRYKATCHVVEQRELMLWLNAAEDAVNPRILYSGNPDSDMRAAYDLRTSILKRLIDRITKVLDGTTTPEKIAP